MSRPQKMHKPINASFTDIINAVADGKGKSALKKLSDHAIQAEQATPRLPPRKKS